MKKVMALLLMLTLAACASAGREQFKTLYAQDKTLKDSAKEMIDNYLKEKKDSGMVQTAFARYSGQNVTVLEYDFIRCGTNTFGDPACFYQVKVGSPGGQSELNTYAISFTAPNGQPDSGKPYRGLEVTSVYDTQRPRGMVRQSMY